MPAIRRRFHRGTYQHRDGPGDHAPQINFTYIDGDIHIELKKRIQSGEERTLLLTVEQFFEISTKSDEIRQAGNAIAGYCGNKSIAKPSNQVGSFTFVLHSDYLNNRHEHMYEWQVPNSELKVNIRNRRSDGKRPIDADFLVEVRVFINGRPTDNGIMMAWHNFHGTFVRYRKERRNRIQEMRGNRQSRRPLTTNDSGIGQVLSTISIPSSTVGAKKMLPKWTIQETYADNEAYSCVICMDRYLKNEQVNGLPNCSHYFHSKCIEAWLTDAETCPVCRAKV